MKSEKAVALRIVNLLLKNNLTRYALCKKSTLDESTLACIINEKYKTVKLDTIILICDGFGMTLSEFFDDDLFKRENLDV